MKVLIDTNIVIDVALERHLHFANSDRLLALSEQNIIEGYLSASTLSDIYYIVRRDKGRVATLDFIQKICSFLQIATVDTTVIQMALNANFNDFEDSIQYSTAICSCLDVIVTRNPQDFPVTVPRILTPSQLIRELNCKT